MKIFQKKDSILLAFRNKCCIMHIDKERKGKEMKNTNPWMKRIVNGSVSRFRAREGLDNNRVRFNWGYHDGAQEVTVPNPRRVKNWKETHHDPIYVKGWEYGQRDAESGVYKETSLTAWEKSGLVDSFTPYRI